MRTLMLAALALAACGEGSEAQARKIDPWEFLRKAVAEGLKADGADRALIKGCIADERNLFVHKCPICEPVRQAFAVYGNDPAPAQGRGFPKDIADDLKNATRLTQLKALERLVDRYVASHYERLKMSPADRQAMQAALAAGKKEGMRMKELSGQKDFGDFCPSCNGASKAK